MISMAGMNHTRVPGDVKDGREETGTPLPGVPENVPG